MKLFVPSVLMLILSICILDSCRNTPKQESTTPPQYKEAKKLSTLEIKQIWDTLCNKKGCLVGGQRVYQGNWGSEGSAFTLNEQWGKFLFQNDKKAIAEFLITQIPDRTKSELHACPLNNATKGELAIYCLQGIFKKNFYELSPKYVAIEKNISTKYQNEQKWIWHIQQSKSELDTLQAAWSQLLNQ